jgi:hypothetical protein
MPFGVLQTGSPYNCTQLPGKPGKQVSHITARSYLGNLIAVAEIMEGDAESNDNKTKNGGILVFTLNNSFCYPFGLLQNQDVVRPCSLKKTLF